MKKIYEQPAMQAQAMYVTSRILGVSNIGEGGEGQQGDVKSFGSFESSEKENLFEENPFE